MSIHFLPTISIASFSNLTIPVLLSAYFLAASLIDFSISFLLSHICDQNDNTNGTSIFELNIDGSTIDRENYENIYLEENELAISPTIDTLYALGTDVHSGIPNLYLIDISL